MLKNFVYNSKFKENFVVNANRFCDVADSFNNKSFRNYLLTCCCAVCCQPKCDNVFDEWLCPDGTGIGCTFLGTEIELKT